MALIRVFLLTCRRATLLPRALNSLRNQTFTDWVCELHNDAPEDDFPQVLLGEINDPRITLHQHSFPWGASKSFLYAYKGGREPFASLLEDDNWWEPDFLEVALAAIQSHPEVSLVWANLHIWRENPDHSWGSTGRTIWQCPSENYETPLVFHDLQPLQCLDALHSNGATVFRSDISRVSPIPDDLLFSNTEVFRERLLPGCFMLLPKPLGHFAITLKTARPKAREAWLRAQLLCAASYQITNPSDKRELETIWKTLRSHSPPATNLLFHVALGGIRPWAILRHAKAIDWFRFLRGVIRHPITSVKGLRFRKKHPKLWKALLSAPHRGRRIQEFSPFYNKIIPPL